MNGVELAGAAANFTAAVCLAGSGIRYDSTIYCVAATTTAALGGFALGMAIQLSHQL